MFYVTAIRTKMGGECYKSKCVSKSEIELIIQLVLILMMEMKSIFSNTKPSSGYRFSLTEEHNIIDRYDKLSKEFAVWVNEFRENEEAKGYRIYSVYYETIRYKMLSIQNVANEIISDCKRLAYKHPPRIVLLSELLPNKLKIQ